MAGSVNKVILVGNLGRDPEVRNTQDGNRVVSFSVATSENWTNKAGERQERTQWHRIAIFNDRIGEVAEKYLRKGHKVYIEGQLQTREYTDKDGNKRESVEIVIGRFKGELTLLEPRAGAGGEGGGYERAERGGGRSGGGGGGWDRGGGSGGGSGGGGGAKGGLDDDIPF